MKLLFLLSFLWLVNSNNLVTSKLWGLESRVLGGYNCSVEEYSYLVSISFGEDGMQYCGGSLVTTSWVLTAAHCCLNIKASFLIKKFKVHLGQKVWLENVVQTTTVEKVVIHKEYYEQSVLNDICVIKLKEEVKLGTQVKLTKLATTEQYNDMIKNKKCNKSLVIGFGDQIFKPRAVPIGMHKGYVDHVQCGNVMVRDQSYCIKTLGVNLPDIALCASDPKPKTSATDSCQGDSGGPLFCNDIQIGLVAAGFGCGTTYPAVYTRVDKFIDFIRTETGEFRKQVPQKVETEPPEKEAESNAGTALIYLRVLFVVLYVVFMISG